MPRLFALDQNFPEPIVDALADFLAEDADLAPIRRIDPRLPTADDWQVLQAVHADQRPWDGLITSDSNMLGLPKELAVLCQTKLTLVVTIAAGHDPIKANGLCSRTSAWSASRPARTGPRSGGWPPLGRRPTTPGTT